MVRSEQSYRRDSEHEPQDETFNIFISNVDSFNGKYILSHLYKQGFGDVENDQNSPKHKKDVEEIMEPKEERLVEGDEKKSEEPAEINLDFLEMESSERKDSTSNYRIYGSLSEYMKNKPDELYEIIHENGEQFKNVITKCNCVIYDISTDDSQIGKALTALAMIEQEIERQKSMVPKNTMQPVMFILISTPLTWALTSKCDQVDQEPLPFLELDYRRRKPHPNYQEHYDCEREVQQKGRRFKGKLQSLIVCAGITYGYEEDTLSFFFKKAWSDDEHLPIFGSGSNYIPLIHIADLCTIIGMLVNSKGLKNQYILAVEQTPTTLGFIVKYVSRALGSGRVQYVTPEEAFLYPEINQYIYDSLTVDLMLEPTFITTTLGIKWKTEMNLIENIEDIVDEFRTHRNLEPLKILVHGPPCSGKTRLAHFLREHYNVHYVSLRSVLGLPETISANAQSSSMNLDRDSKHSQVRSRTSSTKKSKSSVIDQNEDKLREIEDAEEFFDLPVEDSEEEMYQQVVREESRRAIPKWYLENPTTQRLNDDQVVSLVKKELAANVCQNRGFVLDGFPKTFRQTFELFKHPRNSQVSNETFRSTFKVDSKLAPNYVISLDAPDEFLLDRISRAPEEMIQNTHYNERDMVRRLLFFREFTNSEESGVLSYFQESETDIVEIDVSEFPSENMDCICYICTKIIGPSRGFGLTQSDVQEMAIVEEKKGMLLKEKKLLKEKLREQKSRKELDEKMEKLLRKLNFDNIQRERYLAPVIEQYRAFIGTKIIPFVAEAVAVLGEKKPKDPVDFLAEYLFKNNPGGKMYNPRYSRNGEILYDDHIQL